MPIIDIHLHCFPRPTDDPFSVAEQLRGTPAGANMVTNYRGLPAVAYREMTDLELQQAVCANAGLTGRLIRTAGLAGRSPNSATTSISPRYDD